jgi:hypothetical protein
MCDFFNFGPFVQKLIKVALFLKNKETTGCQFLTELFSCGSKIAKSLWFSLKIANRILFFDPISST